MKSDHVYYTLKIFEIFMFLEDENVPLVLGGLICEDLPGWAADALGIYLYGGKERDS